MKFPMLRRHWVLTAASSLFLMGAGCSDDTADPTDSGVAVDSSVNQDGGANADAAPVPGCGDGVLATSEQCEGFELRAETCNSQGFASGQLRCTTSCTLDTSGCAQCGNDRLEEGEVCDGTDVAGATCASLLGAGYAGNVACDENCLGHVADDCTINLPGGNLSACDSSGATPCTGDLECTTTAQGEFCLDTCVPGTAGACPNDGACIDVGPPRTPAFACVARPELGDSCTDDTGCAGGTCEPTFTQNQAPASACVDVCTVSTGDFGQGDCAAGYACAENPAGFYELEAGDIACLEATVTRDCNVAGGNECLTVGMDATGGAIQRCGRYTRHCVTPQDFFGFESTIVPDGARCDLAGPTNGGRYCGLLGSVASDPARVRCFPIFDGIDSVGACVGFCDASLSAAGTVDLSCGSGASCVIPLEPQFFFPQEPRVLCSAGDPRICDGASGFDRCLDLGSGIECARPSKVCAPVGG